MIRHLWDSRSQPKFGSQNWFRAWAKRGRLLPDLVTQWRIHKRLRRRRASISKTSFLSDVLGFTGTLSLLAIGEETFVGRVKIGLHAPVTIGSRVCINDGTEILTASHDPASPMWTTTTAGVTIEDYAWIASRCVILPGVTIGFGAIVGAGAVVARCVPPFTIVVGNPAKPLSRTRCETLDYSPVDQVALFRAWKGF